MIRGILIDILIAILLVLLQAVVCNHICVFDIATPFVFIFIILQLPLSLSINWVMTIAFFVGLSVDIFSDTQGMNALACLLLAVLRHPIFSMYVFRDDKFEDIAPSVATVGVPTYFKYALTASNLYCILICTIQDFSFAEIPLVVMRIIGCTILTTMTVVAIDLLLNSHK